MAAICGPCRPLRATPAFAPAQGGSRAPARQRDECAARGIRSSLEEEFKKQLLGRSNGASSSQPERLKDLSSASASQRAAGGAEPGPAAAGASSSSSSSSSRPQPDGLDEQAAQQPFGGLPLGGEGYHPLEFYPTSQVDLDWASLGAANGAEPWVGAPAGERARCFVILFGVGRAETEGIYSLRAVAKDDGLPVDTIVAFENEDDALRYSTLLEATMDHEPTVWPIEWGELLEFCNAAGYRCRLEPSGSLLIPPDYNVGMTDWERSLKLRKGEFSVLGGEPAGAPGAPAAGGLFVDGPAWVFDPPVLPQGEDEIRREQLNAVLDSQLSSPAALAAMKASLERLLPPNDAE